VQMGRDDVVCEHRPPASLVLAIVCDANR
jgi:hypothetical protein